MAKLIDLKPQDSGSHVHYFFFCNRYLPGQDWAITRNDFRLPPCCKLTFLSLNFHARLCQLLVSDCLNSLTASSGSCYCHLFGNSCVVWVQESIVHHLLLSYPLTSRQSERDISVIWRTLLGSDYCLDPLSVQSSTNQEVI